MPATIKYNVAGQYYTLLNGNCCSSSSSSDLKGTDFSPIYTTAGDVEANLLNFKIVRVGLSTSGPINLPTGTTNLHIRILNTSLTNLDIFTGSGTITIGKELMSFFYTGTEWIYFNGF
jgi:hypothetical protein